jgi:hypothetical protein
MYLNIMYLLSSTGLVLLSYRPGFFLSTCPILKHRKQLQLQKIVDLSPKCNSRSLFVVDNIRNCYLRPNKSHQYNLHICRIEQLLWNYGLKQMSFPWNTFFWINIVYKGRPTYVHENQGQIKHICLPLFIVFLSTFGKNVDKIVVKHYYYIT